MDPGEAARRVLITGASGFVGSAVREAFESAGHRVTGTSTSGRSETAVMDLERPDRIAEVLNDSRPDLVVHLAGIQSVRQCRDDPARAFRVNTGGTAALLREVERRTPGAHFILASSAAVYGDPSADGPVAFVESDPMAPRSPYAASKAAAEVLAIETAARTGMPVTIARLFNQVGPGQPATQVPAGFAAAIARAEAEGEDRVVIELGDPAKARDFTDTRDTARALGLIAGNRLTGRVNVCSGETHSLAQLVEGLSRASAVEVATEVVPARSNPNDVPVIGGTPRRLREETGWSPEFTLEESLAALLEAQRALLRQG
jgi:GDP-4-dehydro-6-deoxy-D-mannose reductase